MDFCCAEINYGHGTAKLWGKFSEQNAESFFMDHANQCFGIRKSISDFKLVALVPCETLPDPWGKFPGATTVLSHSGDVIVWGKDGKKIKTEWD
jgi:hypothetical protein